MNLERTVLLVSPTSQLSRALAPLVRRAGYHVTLARTFESAKSQLDAAPNVVITELKLGEYNGLQLALRGRALGTPAIVLADESFEHEVEQLGAVWMSPEAAASDQLETVLAQLVQNVPVGSSADCPWYDGESEHTEPVTLPESHMSRYLH